MSWYDYEKVSFFSLPSSFGGLFHLAWDSAGHILFYSFPICSFDIPISGLDNAGYRFFSLLDR